MRLHASRVWESCPRALPFALLVSALCLAPPPAAAQSSYLVPNPQCGAAGATSAAQCGASGGYTLCAGQASAACAACAMPGTSLASAAGGCAPPPLAAGTGANDTALFLSMDGAGEGLQAFGVSNAALQSFAADRYGAAQSCAYLPPTVTLTTGPLPALAGAAGAPFSASAFVKCAPPVTAQGRTLLDVWDGSFPSSMSDHLTLFATSATSASFLTSSPGPSWLFTTFSGTGTAGSADGPVSSATFSGPKSVLVDGQGTVYVSDSTNNKVRKIIGGVVSSIGTGTAGTADGASSSATFNGPRGLALDPATNNVWVSDSGNKIRLIYPNGTVTTVAGNGTATSVSGVGLAATVNQPKGVNFSPSRGVLVWAESSANLVRQMNVATGLVSVLAGSGAAAYVEGVGTNAAFSGLNDACIDESLGLIWAPDYGNNRVRTILFNGTTAFVAGSGVAGSADGVGAAASFNKPVQCAVLSGENLARMYLIDNGNNRVRTVSITGVVTTIGGASTTAGFADGFGTTALFNAPSGIHFDLQGQMWFADATSNRIRRANINVNTAIASM